MFDTRKQRELPIVLLIDDDMVSREVTSTLLIMSGYSVHTAEDGDSAVRLLERRACQPEVILMDAQMPGLSGVELIAALRAKIPASVFTVSGSEPPAEILAAADGFLLKPFGSQALAQLIEGRRLEGLPTGQPQVLVDPNLPVVSAKVLARLREEMPENSVREIYAALMADLPARIEALGVAIGKGDLTEVRHIGHTIKGGCGMVGALQVSSLGAKLEMAALEPQGYRSDNIAALLRELRAAADSLKSMLTAEMLV